MNTQRHDHPNIVFAIFGVLSLLVVAILTYPGERIQAASSEPSFTVSYRR